MGSDLRVNERDVRVFNNFADSTANDNNTPSSQFPGQTGLELAMWKGVVEWGSLAHGDGSGDSTQATIGNGGANFDAFWAGLTTSPGNVDSNVISKINSCGGGTLAFAEAPISNGWRIRFCESWTWNDGPGSISGGQFDLQGVMAHEYGHALGLGHSTAGNATMFPSVGSGVTATRSIAADDIAGVQAIYGVMEPTKPIITATVATGGTLVVHGSGFTDTNNQVWFCPSGTTAPEGDPRVLVLGVPSNGTSLSVAIPAAAGPGDVIVKASGAGHSTLSNAFPTDLVGTFGDPPANSPTILSVTPSTLDALIPGTAQTVTISGLNLDTTTDVLLDGAPIAPSRYTLVNASTITLDMPQASSLGSHDLGVTDGGTTDNFGVTIVANASITYELGNGDALNVVDRSNGLNYIVAGTPGKTHRVTASVSNLPSVIPGVIDLALGNNFTMIFTGLDHTIPAQGWLSVFIPSGALVDPGPGGQIYYSQTVELGGGAPFPTSGLQSMTLVQ